MDAEQWWGVSFSKAKPVVGTALLILDDTGRLRPSVRRRCNAVSDGEHVGQPHNVEDAPDLFARRSQDQIATDLALGLEGNHKLPKTGGVNEVEFREIQHKGGNLVTGTSRAASANRSAECRSSSPLSRRTASPSTNSDSILRLPPPLGVVGAAVIPRSSGLSSEVTTAMTVPLIRTPRVVTTSSGIELARRRPQTQGKGAVS